MITANLLKPKGKKKKLRGEKAKASENENSNGTDRLTPSPFLLFFFVFGQFLSITKFPDFFLSLFL